MTDAIYPNKQYSDMRVLNPYYWTSEINHFGHDKSVTVNEPLGSEIPANFQMYYQSHLVVSQDI